MFGSSFASAVPLAPASKKKSSSSSPAPSSSSSSTGLPFAGFSTGGGGGFGGTGAKAAPAPLMGGGGGFSFGSGGSSPLKTSAASPSFGANMFATKSSATGASGGDVASSSSKASAGLAFGGFSTGGGGIGLGGGMSPPKSSISSGSGGGVSNKRTANTSSFSGAASSAAAAAMMSSANKSSSAGMASRRTTSTTTALVPAPVSAVTSFPPNSRTNRNKNDNPSVENSCMSPDGRSFHSYLYDSSMGRHIIISEFAPFGDARVGGGSNTPRGDLDGNISSFKITTVLPAAVSESIDIDPVIGLICVDGAGEDASKSRRRQQQLSRGEEGSKPTTTLPWMCLYTRTSAFLLSIGYHHPEEDDISQQSINGKVLQAVEPFEKQLLMSPRGSSILRIRAAPTSDSVFQRRGSMALLMKEGDDDDNTASGYVLVLYHGLPESILGSGSHSIGGRDFGGRKNFATEGAMTVPLRFSYEDLVRGIEDTIEAENEAYDSGSLRRDGAPTSFTSSMSKRVADFCFMNPSFSSTSSGAGGFAATSILVLCNDGSVYGASPVIFDGTVLPRTVVVDAISHLDEEIEASATFIGDMAPTPVPSLEQERTEARMRQCKAARRYLMDAFGIPEGAMVVHAETPSSRLQGSFYVSASVVHSRSYSSDGGRGGFSQALSWQPRLQGPLVMPPLQSSGDQSSVSSSSFSPYVCIESFGAAAGAGIVDGFAVARDCKASSQIHVEFGIIPGEGAVLLPRFEFESDGDCQFIDELVRGTGAYVEHASITDDKDTPEESLGASPGNTLARISSSGRGCSIVVDPLDDIMVHVLTRSRIVTVTTDAIAATANRFRARLGGGNSSVASPSGIRTKVWSALEVNNSGNAALLGACVSSDVHLGHVLLARVSDGSMEVVNITAAQCLHETSEQMKAKSEQIDAANADDEALQILNRVKPLHELLQPPIDKVCDGLSKMGKIVGGATLPKDAGPENLAVFLDTQRSCEANVIVPMEEISDILAARKELMKEMYDHQAAELVRLSALLEEFKQKYESNLKRVVGLESKASVLAERSSAVLTATRELRPQITDAEAEYFKDLRRYETSCNKWEGTVNQLQKDATVTCDSMSAGAIENGEVRCLVDLPPQKIAVCHKLLRGEAQMLKKLEQSVKESEAMLERLSEGIVSGMDSSEDAARLRLISGDKENRRR